jgi:hypothetical protein
MLQCRGSEGKSRQTAKIGTAFCAVWIQAGHAQFNRTVGAHSLLLIGKAVFNDEANTVKITDMTIQWVLTASRSALTTCRPGLWRHKYTVKDFFLNNQQEALIIQIYSVIKLYMFRTSLPVIRSSILTLLGSGHQKPAWNLPVPNVQQKTPDDGQRRCPKHAEFYNRINLDN